MKLDRFVALNAPAAAAASRALSKLTRRPALVKLLNAKLIRLSEDRPDLDLEELVVGISQAIDGGLQGAALLCFPEAKAAAFAELLVGAPAGPSVGPSAREMDLDESALVELGNIICGNYVTELANRLNVKVIPGLPQFARGAFGVICERVVALHGLDADEALLIDVELDLPAGNTMGRLLLCFESEPLIYDGPRPMKPELERVFMDEGRQLLAAMRRGLVAGEGRPRAIPELFRCAHMLKGNVKMAGFPEMELLVVPMTESLRGAKQRGELPPEQAAAVFEAVEACEDILEGREAADSPALVGRLLGYAGPGAPGGVAKPLVRILLVEDSDLQARIVREELARCEGVSFALERKARLADALERLSQGGLDIVLLDLNLPDSQGLETFAALSARDSAIPVVILTAADDDVLAVAALHKGAQDYLVKGQIDTLVLPRVIRYAIERKRVEESLRKARAELEQRVEERTSELIKANRELALFASAATHELRGPLRKIVIWGDLLKRNSGGALDETGLKLLREMQEAARHQGDLLDSLRELTRVTTQGRPLEPVELDAVVGEVLADIAPRFASAGGRVEVERLPAIRADRVQMGQLFQNLLSNALKYRDKERPPLVAIRCRPLGAAAVEIDVEDNGIGFEQRYAEKIFEPFQRLHGPGTYEGTGMGLAICARIAARHGGALSARGTPGQGATFTMTFPLGTPK